MTALALAGSLAVPASLDSAGATTTGEAILFWCLAPIMVLAASSLLWARRAVHAALSVVVVMISLAFLYVAQDAPFLGVVQVVVYTGAVMMLFLFVLMLVGVDASDSLVETIRGQRWVGALAGVGLAVVLVGVVVRATYAPAVGLEAANADGNPQGVARIIFGDQVLALEVVGALLVTAALGALVLTHRQRLTPRVGQRERAEARVRGGGSLTPLPAPGVYAKHNAMDVPALDPNGRPIEASVPRVLRIRGQEAGIAEYHARFQLHGDASFTPPAGVGGPAEAGPADELGPPAGAAPDATPGPETPIVTGRGEEVSR